jgi:hypothetical protein
MQVKLTEIPTLFMGITAEAQRQNIGDTLGYVPSQLERIVYLTLTNKGTHSEWIPRYEKA